MAKASISKIKIRKKTVLGITLMALLIAGGSYYVIMSMIPVNATLPVFGSPSNIFIKAVKTNKGYAFASQSVKGGKTPPILGKTSPTFIVEKGNLVSMHLINEDKNLPSELSKHNLNIDEFNVHSKDLSYFQTQSITFLADKKGTFDYYCSIHPEMRGDIIVE